MAYKEATDKIPEFLLEPYNGPIYDRRLFPIEEGPVKKDMTTNNTKANNSVGQATPTSGGGQNIQAGSGAPTTQVEGSDTTYITNFGNNGMTSPIFSTIPSQQQAPTDPTGIDNREKTSDENLKDITSNITDYQTYLGSNSDVNYIKLSEIIAKYVANNCDNFTNLTSGERAKINFIFFPKHISSEAEFIKNKFVLRYKTDVAGFTIKSRVRKFGYTGEMILLNNNNSLRPILNYMTNYYMAICISFLNEDNSTSKGLILEPYIVQLESAIEITSTNSVIKEYKVTFRDAISAIAKDISWASIFYFNPTLQYPFSFETLITGVINHLFNISDQLTGDGQITLRRDILYSEISEPSVHSTNLASFCLSEIDPEGSVLDALNVILKYACCELPSYTKNIAEKSNLDFSWFNEHEDSSIMFPLYIMEEYPDGAYINKFFDRDIMANATSEKNFKSSKYKGSDITSVGVNTPKANPVAISTPQSSFGNVIDSLNGTGVPPTIIGGQEQPVATTQSPPAAQQSSPTTTATQPAPAPAPAASQPASASTTPTQATTQPPTADAAPQPPGTHLAGTEITQVTQTDPRDIKRDPLSSVTSAASKLLKNLIYNTELVKGYVYMPRYYTFKNLLMPFQFAFDKDNPIISESINPIKENNTYTADESRYKAFLGKPKSEIYSYTTFPINMNTINDTWKNVMFMGNMADESQTDVFYLEWLINYFADTFLNSAETRKFPSPAPAFLLKSALMFKNLESKKQTASKSGSVKTLQDAIHIAAVAAKIIGNTIKTGVDLIQDTIKNYKKTFKNDSGTKNSLLSLAIKNEKDKELFNYYFSNVKVLKSLYPVSEECWHLGNYIESFVHYNTSYNISILGNMFRRPNEIIKFNKPIKETDSKIGITTSDKNSSIAQQEEYISIDTTSTNKDSVLLYIMSVEHIFNGDRFMSNIFCNRFYDE